MDAVSTPIVVLAFVSALGSGLVAGVFFAFSTFVMRALARLSPAEGICAMQHINVTVITPLFMAALFGSGLTSLALVVAALLDWDGSHGPYLVAGGALYVIGTLVVTMAFNVPRNDELAALDPAAPGSDTVWKRYLAEWTAWNHVRTVAPLVASGLLVAALYVGG